MKKININGQDYIQVRQLREEIRHLRKSIGILYNNFDEDHRAMVHLAYNDIVRVLYREELAAAKTPEEHRAILEMPGDFIVFRFTGDRPNRSLEYFCEWEDGGAVISDCADDAMWFSYESKAEEVASALNTSFECDGWHVCDMSPEEKERTNRLLKAIFSEEGDDGE